MEESQPELGKLGIFLQPITAAMRPTFLMRSVDDQTFSA